MIGRVAFDLLFNAAVAFGLSAILAALIARSTRRLGGRQKLAILALPFLKACLEIARGVPDSAFLWAHARGVPHQLGQFQFGFGVGPTGLRIEWILSELCRGVTYPTSAGELVARGAEKLGASWAIDTIGIGVACVAAALVLRRLVLASRFERRRTKLRAAARALSARSLGRRIVDVHVSEAYDGVPFAGGLFRPYVCFPRAAYDALTPSERDAVLAHEIAHLHHLDPLWLIALGIGRDALWFCPGASWLARLIAAGIERAADERAVREGTKAAVLASAILRMAAAPAAPIHAAAILSPSGIRERIGALVGPAPAPSTDRTVARIAVLLVAASTILFAHFFGNHT